VGGTNNLIRTYWGTTDAVDYYTPGSVRSTPVMTMLATGNVGIGTVSPTNKLEVAGAIKSTTGGIVFPDGTVQLTSATSGTNNSMVTSWPDAIKCSVTNPVWGTNIFYPEFVPYSGNGLYYYRAKLAGTSAYSLIFNANGTFNSYENITTSNCAASITSLYASGQAFNMAKGPAAQWLQNGSAAYYNAGNIGIGSSAPAQTLDVSGGNIRASGEVIGTMATGYGQFRAVNGNYGVFWRNDGSNYYLLSTASGNQYGSWNTNRPMRWDFVNNALYLKDNSVTINSSGNVGISNTSPAGALDVTGDILNNGQAVSGNFKYVGSLSDWRNNSGTCAADTWCDIPGRSISFVKRRAGSILRVMYQDTLGTLGTNYGQCIWRMFVGGTQIAYFSNADITASGWRMDNGTHTGLGVGIAAGTYTIKVQNYRAAAATECLQGWNTASTSFLSVEEVGP